MQTYYFKARKKNEPTLVIKAEYTDSAYLRLVEVLLDNGYNLIQIPIIEYDTQAENQGLTQFYKVYHLTKSRHFLKLINTISG